MPRLAGCNAVTSLPPIEIVPDVLSSSPAINLSNVDFPHPDGPTNTQNSPSATCRPTSWMTDASPNDLLIRRNSSCAMKLAPDSGKHLLRNQQIVDVAQEVVDV